MSNYEYLFSEFDFSQDRASKMSFSTVWERFNPQFYSHEVLNLQSVWRVEKKFPISKAP